MWARLQSDIPRGMVAATKCRPKCLKIPVKLVGAMIRRVNICVMPLSPKQMMRTNAWRLRRRTSIAASWDGTASLVMTSAFAEHCCPAASSLSNHRPGQVKTEIQPIVGQHDNIRPLGPSFGRMFAGPGTDFPIEYSSSLGRCQKHRNPRSKLKVHVMASIERAWVPAET
jgi:hypothetical protein